MIRGVWDTQNYTSLCTSIRIVTSNTMARYRPKESWQPSTVIIIRLYLKYVNGEIKSYYTKHKTITILKSNQIMGNYMKIREPRVLGFI